MKTHFNLLSLILIMALTACSPKSVKDDWPGVNGLNNKVDVKTFNFDSKLSLPKMGKDISYTISSVCNRKRPLSGAAAQPSYSRLSSFSASENNKSFEDIINILPSEVLIYPEFFSDCSFQIKATNKNGSTEEPASVKLALKHKNARTFIDVNTPEKNNLNKHIKIISLEEVSKLTLKPSTPSDSIKNISLTCFSKSLRKTSVLDGPLDHPSLDGSALRIPLMVSGFPVEDCIIEASSIKDNKLLVSKRFQVLNSQIHNNISITPVLNKTSALFSPLLSRYPILYNQPDKSNPLTILSLQLENRSSEDTDFEIGSIFKTNPIQAIEGLHTSENYDGMTLLNFSFKPVTAPFAWLKNGEPLTTPSLHLKSQEVVVLSLVTIPSFGCSSQTTNRPSEELGFVVSLEQSNPLLQFKQVTENEFLRTSFIESEIVQMTTPPGNMPYFKRSNLPSPYAPEESGLKIYFANAHYNEPVSLILNNDFLQGDLYSFKNKISASTTPVDACRSLYTDDGYLFN